MSRRPVLTDCMDGVFRQPVSTSHLSIPSSSILIRSSKLRWSTGGPSCLRLPCFGKFRLSNEYLPDSNNKSRTELTPDPELARSIKCVTLSIRAPLNFYQCSPYVLGAMHDRVANGKRLIRPVLTKGESFQTRCSRSTLRNGAVYGGFSFLDGALGRRGPGQGPKHVILKNGVGLAGEKSKYREERKMASPKHRSQFFHSQKHKRSRSSGGLAVPKMKAFDS